MAEKKEVFVVVGREDSPVHIAITDFRGSQMLDIRRMWTTPTGELAPTHKGVCISLEYALDFFNALAALLDDAGITEVGDVPSP